MAFGLNEPHKCKSFVNLSTCVHPATVRQMTDEAPEVTACRSEVLPAEGKEVAILTFRCDGDCQAVWPEGKSIFA